MGSLAGFYSMANGFLAVVQPRTVDQLVEALNIRFSKPFWNNNYEALGMYVIGYAVCIVIGLLFVLLMPLMGCCTCCCRCCNCCCGKRITRPSTRCQRVGYGAVVFTLSVMVLAAMAGGLSMNSALDDETTGGKGINRITSAFNHLETYRNGFLDEVQVNLFDRFNSTKLQIFDVIDAIPQAAVEKLGEVTQAGPLLQGMNFTVNGLPDLNRNLKQMDQSRDILIRNVSALEDRLAGVRANLTSELNPCSSTECNSVKVRIRDLVTVANFSKSTSVTPTQIVVEASINSSLLSDVQRSIEEMTNLTNNVNNAARGTINQIKNQTNQLHRQLETQGRQVMRSVRNISFKAISRQINNPQTRDTIRFVGSLRTYAFMGLLGIIGVIVGLNMLALLCGCLCKAPKKWKGNPCCTTKRPAGMLVASTFFIFIFSWLWMLITMVTFLLGGALRNEVCRYLVLSPEVRPSVTRVDNMLGQLLQRQLNMNTTMSLLNITESCRRNHSLYQAINMESMGLNIDQLLDLRRYGIDRNIESLSNISISIGNITLITPEMNNTLYNLSHAVKQIDFASYETELGKPVTQTNLTEFADDLSKLPSPQNQMTKPMGDLLRQLDQNDVGWIRQERSRLRRATGEAKEYADNVPIAQIAQNLSRSQDNLNAEGSAIMRGIMNGTAHGIWGILTNFTGSLASSVRHNMGRCHSVYLGITTVIAVPCVHLLNPFNGIWFALGWCIFFMVPMVIFNLKLAGVYRRPPVKTVDPI